MNFLKRSFLSVKARKGKSLLQIFVFTVICVLVLAGLSIQTAAKKSGDLARQKLGANVTLQVDMEKMREQMQSQQTNGERMRFQSAPIPAEAAEELTSYEQIKGYNFYSSTTALASSFEPITNNESGTTEEGTTESAAPGGRMGGGMAQGDVSLQGVSFTDSTAEFMDGTASIIEGEHITEDDLGKNVVLIEQTLAEENGLKVGDSITVANPRDDSATLELQIKGIYQTASTGSDQGMDFTAMIPYNKLYVPYTNAAALKGSGYEGTIDSATYYIDDPADMESFVAQAKKESSIDFETFKLDANDQLYQQMVGPIENVASFSNNIVYLVSIAGAIILGLIVMMSIRERKYEMGVLLAIGERRWKMAGQFIAEILLVAALSLGIATLSGNIVAKEVSDQLLNQELQSAAVTSEPESFRGGGMRFGGGMPGMPEAQSEQAETIQELDVSVTAEDLAMLAMIGILIAALSALLPSLTVLRLQPKTILSRQD
ncbi:MULTISPECIES: ABC transporter permease [Bacillus]|uniref:ABC transporter permease n=1 Tax=Bacillus TaxID=1386 RepID=UPI000C7605EC|nr:MULTISPECIES: ABC transporter permease [unclassified Bacillus (in: firmicutes)]MDT0161198.1 ABC transporter permease [Bacillus sp. AG4(2022)]PLR73141.1 macrolide ABC transporter permease [Bacillus sp. UMB0728]